MKSTLLASLLVGVLTAAGTAPASAVDVPGGGNKKADCDAGFSVEGTSNSQGATLVNPGRVDQLACNGSCTFSVSLCTNVAVSGCTPSAVTGFTKKKQPSGVDLPLPTINGTDHACGDSVEVTVPLKGAHQTKPGKAAFKIIAAASGTPSKDVDKLLLRCAPNKANTGCTGGGGPAACPTNTAGGADEIVFTVLDHGTDLDNGWTGTSQNFPVPSGSQLKYCLSGCNATDQPVCQGTGSTGGVAGQDSLNGNTFGPPLPLIAGGVPVCVINRFNGDITGTSDLSTGAQTGTVNLFSDVFVTDATRVCPRCNGGKCDSGRNANQNCTVDGMVNVAESLAPDKNFALSRDCPPAGSPVGTLNITLPLTTGTDGTPGTGASKPCREREAQGVPVKDDSCGGAGCGAPCQGKSCTSMAPSPIDPNTMVCIDSKGGISQLCCNNDPTTPCFATAPGGVGISRTGRPLPPQPAWPADQTYPKTASGVVIVATFCEAASGAFNVDQVTGLPGPGAVIFNTKTDYLKAP